jgi:hypothetical protein
MRATALFAWQMSKIEIHATMQVILDFRMSFALIQIEIDSQKNIFSKKTPKTTRQRHPSKQLSNRPRVKDGLS